MRALVLITTFALVPLLIKAQDNDTTGFDELLKRVLNEMEQEGEYPPSHYTQANAWVDIEKDSLQLVLKLDIFEIFSTHFELIYNFSEKYRVDVKTETEIWKFNKKEEDIDGYNHIILNHLIKIDKVRSEFLQLSKIEKKEE